MYFTRLHKNIQSGARAPLMSFLCLDTHAAQINAYQPKEPMSDYTRKILLSLTPNTVSLLDEAAKALGMCRSDVIRRSLARDLDYVMNHEVPNMQRFHQETTAAQSSWLTNKRWLK